MGQDELEKLWQRKGWFDFEIWIAIFNVLKYHFQPKNVKCDFPDIEEILKESEDNKSQTDAYDDVKKQKQKFKQEFGVSGGRKQGIPTFFGIWIKHLKCNLLSFCQIKIKSNVSVLLLPITFSKFST